MNLSPSDLAPFECSDVNALLNDFEMEPLLLDCVEEYVSDNCPILALKFNGDDECLCSLRPDGVQIKLAIEVLQLAEHLGVTVDAALMLFGRARVREARKRQYDTLPFKS